MPPKLFSYAPVKSANPVDAMHSPRFIGRSGLRSRIGVMAGRLSYLGGNRGNQGRNQR
jgi:hypothetical protein